LTGTTPFPNASDEEIVAGVGMGYRPDYPYKIPSQGLVDELWDQIEACWHDDPEQRPAALTVLQFLQGLNQERTQEETQEFRELQESKEPQEPLERDDDDDAWECIEYSPEPRACGFLRL
jgi:hypothetical protein